ncbi:MAG: NADH-quinone oxidoreductase subunit N [Ignavibacteria bacterium]|nr:NADH-quinone oxidoreductase subunit N [Ignavibacteria bacterium]
MTGVEDLLQTTPLLIVSISGLVVLVIDSIFRNGERLAFWLAATSLLASGLHGLYGIGETGTAFSGMLTTGGYADFCAALFSLAGFLTLLLSRDYIGSRTTDRGEYYVLILFAVAGMILMASAADLVVLFLGLEMMSLCFYVLAGFTRTSFAGNEASLKYFLLGAFATGFLLYGIAFLYGAVGSTNIDLILSSASHLRDQTFFLIGLSLLLIGFLFKVAAVPFHMWVPDVYEGAPTTVTGFMSTGGKAAAFSALLLVFAPRLASQIGPVREVIAVIAAVTMIGGNILALSQENIKRMLAYSSVAHAGYLLTGVVAANGSGSTGILFYLAAYTLMNCGAFGVVALLESREGGRTSFQDYSGLSKSSPVLAGLMALFMFSLTGIPPFAGFFAKYAVFSGAVAAGYTWLAIIGVLASLISVYYYLRLVVLMYFSEGEHPVPAPVPLAYAALLAAAGAVLFLGLFPSTILDLTATFF